jgi:hypothetical protein
VSNVEPNFNTWKYVETREIYQMVALRQNYKAFFASSSHGGLKQDWGSQIYYNIEVLFAEQTPMA